MMKGENDKRLAQILNEIDDRLVDVLNAENEKLPEDLKKFLESTYERIVNACNSGVCDEAYKDAEDYLGFIKNLLRN